MGELKAVICQIIYDVANRETVKLPVVQDDTIIFGEGAAIDSLDLVNILVEIEEWVENNSGDQIELVDEDSLIADDSPFKTPLSLANYTETKIQKK